MDNNINQNNNSAKSSLSVAGFICSLCGFITCGLTSIVGLILSIVGLSDSKKKGKSDGLAIAGIVISSILLLFFILMIIVAAISPTEIEKTQENEISNKTTENNPTQNSTKPVRSYEKVDVDILETERKNNAAAAKEKYNGKYLEITGRLGTVDSDLYYISLLSPTDDWDFMGIHCKIKNSETKEIVKTLSKDQTIVVRGKITDVGEVLGYYLDIDEIIQ